ncbi:MAG: hypothetical protein LH616_15090, partial [Ilumatobacteraceae bacterium]|nr:hypothetical protein [Ilumatobacteraceae bacterium]
ALEVVWSDVRPLLVIDGFDHMRPLGPHLRSDVLPRLATGARVAIARRGQPEAGWSQEGWDALSTKRWLQPLTDSDAHELVSRLAVDDAQTAQNLVRWAAGLPLALTAGAELALALHHGPSEREAFESWVGSALLRQIVDDEVGELNRDVLLVASIATTLDASLIREVLGVDPAPVMAWLRGLSFIEVVGPRASMHDRLRTALHAELRRTDAEYERDLRRRVADNLYERANAGEVRLINELRLLVADDEAVRWGLGEDVGPLYRTDDVLPGDAEHIAAQLGAVGHVWWQRVQRWFEEAPEHVVIIRDAAGAAVGSGVWTTPASSPPWATTQQLAAPWLTHARRHAPDGNAVMLLDVVDLLADAGPVSPVVSLGNAAVITRCGLANPRWIYASVAADDTPTLAFVGALGFVHVPELDVTDHRRPLITIVRDHGPGGVMARTRDLVYRDLGLEPPTSFDNRDAVRQALRDYHDSIALAKNPLARGAGALPRAETVRALVLSALDLAFGDRDDDQLTRSVIERGYIQPDGGHDRAQRALFMSRTTYFRRSSAGVDRIAAAIKPPHPHHHDSRST